MAEFYTNVAVSGNKILVRGYRDGQQYFDRVDFYPTLYVKSKDKNSKFKTLYGVPVDPIEPGTIKDCRQFVENYKDVEGFDIFGQTNYGVQYISSKWTDKVKWNLDDIVVKTIDIETAAEDGFPDVKKADQEILLITIRDKLTKETITFTSRPYTKKHEYAKVINCNSEDDMLMRFLDYWTRRYPDVITGWNVEFFDIPYLCKRIEIRLGEQAQKRLSPFGYLREKEVARAKSKVKEPVFEIYGIEILDYMDLYKKFTYTTQESYTLDYICFVELGEEKLDWSEWDTFKDFYNGDFDKFTEYNIHDVWLVDKLDEKMELIALIITTAYEAKINYSAVFSPVAMWDSLIYNYLLKYDVVIPKQTYGRKSEKYEGAYVMEPILGGHDWVVSFDATSLYPSIIQAYNISPETFVMMDRGVTVEKLLKRDTEIIIDKDYTMCANGAMFSMEKKGVFGALVDYFMEMRKSAKRKMLDKEQELELCKKLDISEDEKHKKIETLEKEIASLNNQQMATKIALNSLYGAAGNEFFRYFNIEIARAITLSGQYIIREVSREIDIYFNKIVGTTDYKYAFYGDTDSQYLRLGKFVDKFFSGRSTKQIVNALDKVCKEKVGPVFDRVCEDLCNYTNTYRKTINFKREAIADRGLWGGKKRYILRVHNSEGVAYDEPKIKIVGFEIIKSSTPSFVRKKLREAIPVILDGTEKDVQKYVAEYKKEFKNMALNDIAFPRGVNGLSKWSDVGTIYKSRCPIHARGALLFNHHLKRLDLTKKYERIKEGEKIKFVYLKMPNPIHENVITWPVELPKEFGLERYIDYDTMFEKVFTTNLDNVISHLGWSSEAIASFAEWI